MQIQSAPQSDMFRTATTSGGTQRVDRSAKVIFGASLMQEGDLNDERQWTVDNGTLANALELMSRSNNGSKARFTHPNMSADGMGSYLGRWKNPRIDGNTLRADLHFADSAFKTPNGDLASYVMDMAEESPEDFGISLATKVNHAEMEKLKLEKQAENAEWKGRVPMRFRAIHAADVVDEPAATRGGLFSLSEIDNRNLPAQATALLDAYFSDAEPEVVTARINGFLATYFKSKGLQMPEQKAAPEPDVKIIAAEPLKTVDLSAERAQAAEQARKDERERVTKIAALCKQAGKPELADKFSENGSSVADVQAELLQMLCKSNTPVGEDGGAGEVSKPDENAKYREEFKAGHYSMTEEQYVSLRRCEDGLEEFVQSKK